MRGICFISQRISLHPRYKSDLVSILPQLKAGFRARKAIRSAPLVTSEATIEFKLIDPGAAPGFFGQKDLVLPEGYLVAG
jgi:hypothetical protein